MNDTNRRSPERLPIKLVLPKQGTEQKVPGGGSPPKPFRKVDDGFRQSLSNSVEAIRELASQSASPVRALPVRVKLAKKALAKSHRPDALFNARTCPIIGAGAPGEIFVRGTSAGLRELRRQILEAESDKLIKDISTIEAVEPVTPMLRRKGKTPLEILQSSPRRGRNGFLTRVRLFDFDNEDLQAQALAELQAYCRSRGLELSRAGYSERSQVVSVACTNEEDVEGLTRLVSVRSVIGMPRMRVGDLAESQAKPLPSALPRREDVQGDVPCVVVVDSGVSTGTPNLGSWIEGTISTVAPAARNPYHGTFVSGLIVWGDRLNPDLPEISQDPCAVFDLQVIPNHDPAVGDTEELLEQEFLLTLEQALVDHAGKYKVWNLSLGTDEVCREDEFSAFAEQLDELQERFGVQFVIAAGNYDSLPLLSFPRTGRELAHGRITAPADSVLGLTVGSVAHVSKAPLGPAENELSPFSRHGAGPNHIIKPELVHFGGTCRVDGRDSSGIVSVAGSAIVEDMGTSFSTPLVSRSLAQVFHQVSPTPSPVLAKALLIHHARDPRSGDRVPLGDEDFFGFGLPMAPPYCLECSPHEATLLFEDTLRPGFFLEWDHFPYPTSLVRNGRFTGEVRMTVAFAPTRGARWGSEYCETHIDASFGTYRPARPSELAKQKNRKEIFEGQVPLEHADPGRLYEEVQVKELRKWAPVRSYFGRVNKKGLRWRLVVRLLTRHDSMPRDAQAAQPFALVVTIRDPENTAPVYDEMTQMLRSRFKTQNLAVRTPAQIRAR